MAAGDRVVDAILVGGGVMSATVGALINALEPRASTSVAIVLELRSRCFPERLKTDAWQARLRRMIPTFGLSLPSDPALCRRIRRETGEVLGLEERR